MLILTERGDKKTRPATNVAGLGGSVGGIVIEGVSGLRTAARLAFSMFPATEAASCHPFHQENLFSLTGSDTKIRESRKPLRRLFGSRYVGKLASISCAKVQHAAVLFSTMTARRERQLGKNLTLASPDSPVSRSSERSANRHEKCNYSERIRNQLFSRRGNPHARPHP
jgi:hypothetical protein